MLTLNCDYNVSSETRILDRDEVLQPSSLAGYQWPENDPSLVRQATRLRNSIDFQNIRNASTNVIIDWEMFEKNHRNKNLAEKVFQLLTNSKFQFNTRTLILNESIWLERIRRTVELGEPIRIVYPLFCKIGNWAKQMTNIGPNAGEESTILFFGHLNNTIKKIYEPGIKIAIITDAQLYNSAFKNAEVEVITYINECRQLIESKGANVFIDFINYVDLLAEISNEYLDLHVYYQKVICKSPEKILNGIHAQTLFDSVKASINTRKFRMDYTDQKDIFGNIPNKNNRHYATIDRMTMDAFEEVLCIRLACGQLNVFENIWPDHIRVTCHKGLKNGIAVVGLRPYPEYYGCSKLLPYHGVPLVSHSKRGLKLEIQPEVMLRGRLDLVRVLDEKGHTYYYDGIDNK